MNMNKRIIATEVGNLIWKIVRFIMLIGLSYILVYPILYMVSMAIRPNNQVMDPSVIWIPKSVTIEQFVTAFSKMKYSSAFVTTLVMSLVATVLQLISCSMVGYGLARFRFRGSGLLFTLVMLTLIVPVQQSRYFEYFTFDSRYIMI